MKPKKNRIIEIDTTRGIAVILMILYHFTFDLHYFEIVRSNFLNSIEWNLLRDVVAGIFITLVGVSLYIKVSTQKYKRLEFIKKQIKRGFFILFLGILISIITYFFISPFTYIRFGILHLIGLSLILITPLINYYLKTKKIDIFLIIGTLIFIFGSIINQFTCPEIFIPFGCTPSNFMTLDYFPLFPLFGLVLIGFWLGDKLQIHNTKAIKNTNQPKFIKLLSFIGQNSLLIYILHQPILIGIILFFRNF